MKKIWDKYNFVCILVSSIIVLTFIGFISEKISNQKDLLKNEFINICQASITECTCVANMLYNNLETRDFKRMISVSKTPSPHKYLLNAVAEGDFASVEFIRAMSSCRE